MRQLRGSDGPEKSHGYDSKVHQRLTGADNEQLRPCALSVS